MNNSLFEFLSLGMLGVFLAVLLLTFIFLIRIILYMVKKDKKFPRRNLFAIVTGSAIIAIYFYHFTNNIEFFPEGYLNQSILSPTGQYELKTYNISSLFIDDKTLRAEVVDTQTKKATTRNGTCSMARSCNRSD